MTAIYFVLYFVLRIFSYFFGPTTPLYHANPVNTFFAALVLFIAHYFFLKKDERGWLIVAGEIILGGGGRYLTIGPLALRTWLLLSSLLIYFLISFRRRRGGGLLIFILLGIVALAAVRGLYFHHNFHEIYSDTLPYVFLYYYFPLKDLLASENFKVQAKKMLFVSIIGNAIFTLFTYIGFSAKFFAIFGPYYHWFRDVAVGKITELGFNSYRIVLDEHLLMIPILLFFIARLIMKKINSRHVASAACLLFILSINITRIYVVALAVGLIFLFSKVNWKKWLLYSASALAIFFFFFTSLHLISSGGRELGWEIFGLRLQSIVEPQIEDSSLSRLLTLPKVWEKIKAHPLLGNGLGDTVTVYSPVLKQTITTPQFDWGYLEIWAEMGLLGLIAWVIFLSNLVLHAKNDAPFFLASIISLFIINFTSPALFHVFGLIWLALTLAIKQYSSSLAYARENRESLLPPTPKISAND